MRIIKIAGLEEVEDQMEADLTQQLIEANENLKHMDESFLLNNVGDVHGEDKVRSLKRLMLDEQAMDDYYVIKSSLLKALFAGMVNSVENYNMAFINSAEKKYFTESLSGGLDYHLRQSFSGDGNGYGRTLFQDYGFEDFPIEGADNLKEQNYAMGLFIKGLYDSARRDVEADQKERMANNYIGKRVSMQMLIHNGKMYNNAVGTLKSLNRGRANVDFEIDGQIVNQDVKFSLLEIQ